MIEVFVVVVDDGPQDTLCLRATLDIDVARAYKKSAMRGGNSRAEIHLLRLNDPVPADAVKALKAIE
jgi:hypothetical protein